MKKILITGLLTSLALGLLQAQDDSGVDRIKSMRIAYISNLLQLTPDESQRFWPLYNQFESDQKKIRDKYRADRDPALLSDQEVEKFIQDGFEMEEQLLKSRRDFVQKLKPVLSVRKIALLTKAERNFNREILQRWLRSTANNRAKNPTPKKD